MNFLKFLVALAATLLVGTLEVSAAITEFPFGSTNKLVQYYVPRTDYLSFDIWLPGETFNIFLGWVKVTETGESINALATRSQDELVQFIQRTLQARVMAALPKVFKPEMEGKTFLAGYGAEKRVPGAWGTQAIMGFQNPFTVSRRTDGSFAVSEGAFTVDLASAVTHSTGMAIFASGVKSAMLTLKDISGKDLAEFRSEDADPYNPYGINIYHEIGTIGIWTKWMVVPTHGEVRVIYEDGREEVTDLYDGTTLITYLSPPVAPPGKRLGVPKITEKGVELVFEATDDEQVLIKRASPDFKMWEPLPYLPIRPPITATGARPTPGSLPVKVRTATAPRDNDSGVFKAEVVSPVAQQAQKR